MTTATKTDELVITRVFNATFDQLDAYLAKA